jgi:zinc protease
MVITKETPGSKAATVQIWVKAGSVYEDQHEGGITHLIEHMIFKGTPSRGPGRLAADIEALGGRINAYTSYEYTVYHATLSSRHWSQALEVLTDAVRHSVFDPDELAREKKVVLEEIRMRKDRPSIRLFQELMAQAYNTHPYRQPISGTEQSVSAITREDILGYMEKHYHPENMMVVMVGDVMVEQVVDKVQELMADLPQSELAESTIPKEPSQQKSRLLFLEDDINQTHLALGFPISQFESPDTPVLDVMTHILAQGDTSRLYQRLRNETGLVYRIDGSAFTPRDPGLLEITATLEPTNIIPALEEILTEVFKMKYLYVSDEELARAKRNLESDFVFNLERAEGQARVLGSFQFLADDPREEKYLDQVRAVSKEEIKKAASFYLRENRLTAGIIAPRTTEFKLDETAYVKLIEKADAAAKAGLPASQVSDAYLTNVHRFSLSNGIELLVREDHEIPTTSIRVVFPGGLRSETETTNGAFAFISELLPKGTQKLSAMDVARQVANMAGNISGFNGKNTFGLKADFLARFFEPGLQLVRDIVRTPAFAPEEAEKIRVELLSQLKHQEDALPSLAFKEFNQNLFRGHPYGLNTAGEETALKNFTVASLEKIYENHAKPEAMVIAVAGDVDADEVKELVMKFFSDWQSENHREASGIEEESLLPPDPPTEPLLVSIPRDKQQVHIIIGFLGTTLTSDDRYGLEVLDTVLSGQSGRLFTELRDKQSLAYSLSSFSLLGLDTGSFGIYIGTSPDKKDETIKAAWQQLFRIREAEISKDELEKAKNILITQYELNLQTHSAQAMEMALNATYGLGQDFGNRYIHAIEQVDPATVLEMARKYIRPTNYVMVTVGAENVKNQDENDLTAVEPPTTEDENAPAAVDPPATKEENDPAAPEPPTTVGGEKTE